MNLDLDRSSWARVHFGEVVIQGKESVDPADGTIERYVAGEHMVTDALTIHRWGYVNDGYLGPAFHRRFRPGQVLYGSRRTYLRKVAVADFDGVCANTTFVLNTKDPSRLSQRFLPFLMTSEVFHAFAIRESKGSVNPYVNFSDLARFEFDLPPLDEQQRIADLLWALEDHRLSLMDERVALTNARDLHVGKAVEASGGKKVTLDSIASVTSGLTLGPARTEYAGRAAYLRVANVQRGLLNLSEIKEIPVRDGELQSKSLRPGDILVVEGHASATEVGRAAMWARAGAYTFQNHLFRVRVGDDARPEFVLEMINGATGRQYIRTQAKSTSGLNTINSKVVKALPLRLPGLTEQDRILEISDQYVGAHTSLREAVNDAERVYKSIIASIFGGRP